jgi:hypothetical protein
VRQRSGLLPLLNRQKRKKRLRLVDSFVRCFARRTPLKQKQITALHSQPSPTTSPPHEVPSFNELAQTPITPPSPPLLHPAINTTPPPLLPTRATHLNHTYLTSHLEGPCSPRPPTKDSVPFNPCRTDLRHPYWIGLLLLINCLILLLVFSASLRLPAAAPVIPPHLHTLTRPFLLHTLNPPSPHATHKTTFSLRAFKTGRCNTNSTPLPHQYDTVLFRVLRRTSGRFRNRVNKNCMRFQFHFRLD